MRGHLIGAYVIVFALLVALNLMRDPCCTYEATRSLSANHLLVEGDVLSRGRPSGRGPEGQYLKAEKAKGAPILDADLQPFPVIASTAQTLGVLIPVERSFVQSGAVNARTAIRVCSTKAALNEASRAALTVQAVWCETTAAKTCATFLQLSTAQAAAYKDVLAPDAQPSAKPINDGCG